jgi:hypothetical protein
MSGASPAISRTTPEAVATVDMPSLLTPAEVQPTGSSAHSLMRGIDGRDVCLFRFHEVEPQKDLELMAPQQAISQRLLKRNPRIIPYPALSEKTLVLSEFAVVGTRDTPDGQLTLMVRWGWFFFLANPMHGPKATDTPMFGALRKDAHAVSGLGSRTRTKQRGHHKVLNTLICDLALLQGRGRVPGQYGACEGAAVPLPLA